MALRTPVRAVTRRIADAVRSYAASQGLCRDEYVLAGTYSTRTERFSLYFGTIRPIDELQWYAGILQAIRQAFPEYPEVTMHIGLIVQQVQDLEQVYLRAICNDDEVDLTDDFERA